MKLLCLTVSLVAAFTVEPWPDSQHLITAEQPHGPGFTPEAAEQPQGPGFTPEAAEQPQGPGFTPEQSEGNSIISEPQLFDLEEEKGQSESELRGSGCKAKPSCSIPGGYCVSSASLCKAGRLVSAGCKGSCQCCIPECSEEQGYFRSPGSYQCFKLYTDWRNWTNAGALCKANGMVLAHPYDAVSLRSYLVERFGYSYPWLNARGTGSYLKWQDNGTYYPYIQNYDPLWYTGYPGSYRSTSYCLAILGHSYYRNRTATQPYYSTSCRYTRQTLCQVVWE